MKMFIVDFFGLRFMDRVLNCCECSVSTWFTMHGVIKLVTLLLDYRLSRLLHRQSRG